MLTEIVSKSRHTVLDPTMALVYELARTIGQIRPLPRSVQNITVRAALVNHIDSNVIANTRIWTMNHSGQILAYPGNLAIFLNRTANESSSYIPDVNDVKDLVSMALRLWVGCIEAAKMIRFSSVIESNEFSFGKVSFERIRTGRDRRIESLYINSLASMDILYLAGAEAAPELKKLRKEYYSLEGVSQNSPVRGYPNEYLKDFRRK
ncbi:MAG: hypothetical protein WBE34_12490, partial [Candidatus Nitrosopolaris sp.]